MNNHIFPSSSPLSLAAPALNLRRLCIIRCIVLSCLSCASLYAYLADAAYLSTDAIMNISGIIVIVGLLTACTFVRLKLQWPVTEPEFFSHLLIDILGLSGLLYFTGGASNPFVSYYLVPLTISAATLPWRYTWAITALSLLAYSLMLYFYIPLQPLEPHHGHHSDSHNLHILGMWFNFLVSAVLITYFVVRMSKTLRDQEEDLHETREHNLKSEQLLGIATLAAGTAHELGTPMSTMSVLISELEREHKDNKNIHGDVIVLKEQLDICKNALRKLVDTAERHRSGASEPQSLHKYIQSLIDQWRVVRPETRYSLEISNPDEAPTIEVDQTLSQAIHNVLNNAADANPENVEIRLDWDDQTWLLAIKDYGPGISMEIADQLGKPFVTTKGKGLGLGLFLTHATISRYGGNIKMFNHEEGGTLTEITIPRRHQVTESP